MSDDATAGNVRAHAVLMDRRELTAWKRTTPHARRRNLAVDTSLRQTRVFLLFPCCFLQLALG